MIKSWTLKKECRKMERRHFLSKGCDVTVKLRQLEARRLYFFRMCEPSKRSTYIYCQESKLVRIVLEHICQDPDYKDCVSRVLDFVKVKKMIQGSRKKGSKKSSLNLNSVPDMHERSFSDDWLSSWLKLLEMGCQRLLVAIRELCQ
jgi:hypothetical protein